MTYGLIWSSFADQKVVMTIHMGGAAILMWGWATKNYDLNNNQGGWKRQWIGELKPVSSSFQPQVIYLRIYSNVGNPRIGSETEDSLNRSSNIASKIWLIIAELSNIWPILALRKKKSFGTPRWPAYDRLRDWSSPRRVPSPGLTVSKACSSREPQALSLFVLCIYIYMFVKFCKYIYIYTQNIYSV